MDVDPRIRDRLRGCVVGAAVGDALGMPLEFGPRRAADDLVRDMLGARIPAGSFTDDTEMALALADSLMAHSPLDPTDLGQRFAAWFRSGPSDVGIHTGGVLRRISAGEPWEEAAGAEQRRRPDSAGNGSVMRCWPVAVSCWDDLARLLAESRLQSRVTHPHTECVEGCAFVNAAIYYLARGVLPAEALARAQTHVELPPDALQVLRDAPGRRRDELSNSGWVRATLESAVWGLRTTDSFKEAVVQVVNLGNDADTVGAVAGALAGAAYGLEGIPQRWQGALQGEWPLKSGKRWRVEDLMALADALMESGERQEK